MRTGLPTSFLLELKKKHRKPILLADFYFNDQYWYLSDRAISYGGTEVSYDYEPWIESWGSLSASVSNSNHLVNGDLEIESQRITVIKCPASMPFIRGLFEFGVENVPLQIYQTFSGLDYADKVLIGDFVLRDPIGASQRKMTFELNAVSKLSIDDDPLVDPPEGRRKLEYAIGEVNKVSLNSTESAILTKTTEHLPRDYTGKIYLENTVGLSTDQPYLRINNEVIGFDQVTEASVNIISRGLFSTDERPHAAGSYVYLYYNAGAQPNFIYDVCAGPVESLDNLQLVGTDNELTPYQHMDHVVFQPEQNPARVLFANRPPWIATEETGGTTPITPDPVFETRYGSRSEYFSQPLTGAVIAGPDNASKDDRSYATMQMINSDGGGKVTIKKSPTSGAVDNVFTPGNYDKIMGSWTGAYMRFSVAYHTEPAPNQITVTIPDGGGSDTVDVAQSTFPPNGEEGSVIFTHATNLSYLGTLTKQEVTVTLGAEVKGASVEVKIYLIDNLAGEHLLDTLSHSETSDLIFGSSPSWADGVTPSTYDVSSIIEDFNDLAGAKIKVTFKMNSLVADDRAGAWVTVDQIFFVSSYEDLPPGGLPVQELVGHYNSLPRTGVTLQSVSASITYEVFINNAEIDLDIIARFTSDPVDNTIISTKNISESTGFVTETFDLGITDPSFLQALRFGLRQTLIGPTDAVLRQSRIRVERIEFILEYQEPDYYDIPEQFVQIADHLVVDVVGIGGSNQTPASIINRLHPIEPFSLSEANSYYNAENWFLNGLLPADSTKNSVIRECLRQGIARLVHSGGETKIIVCADLPSEIESVHDFDHPVENELDFDFGAEIKNEPSSGIKNDITVNYGYDLLEETFNGKSNISNVPVGSVGQQKQSYDYNLVDSQVVAEKINQRLIDGLSVPATILTIQSALDTGFVLEKEDIVSFPNFLYDGARYAGRIISVRRIFCSGKNKKGDRFKIDIINPVPYTIPQETDGDNFDSPILISGNSGSITGDNTGFTRETNEPLHAGTGGENSVWFKWIAPDYIDLFISTNGSSYDTVLAVYTGATIDTLAEIVSNDDAPGNAPLSEIILYADQGVEYYIVVAGKNLSEYGSYQLSWEELTGGG